MTMAEYEKKVVGLLEYLGFTKYEKVKLQRFLSGIPSFYNGKIQYHEPVSTESHPQIARG
jgi:hypothetical protein